MMFTILDKKEIAPNTFWFEAKAPLVAHARKAGQFMIISPHEKAERIPISLAGSNYKNSSLYFVIQAIGKTTKELCSLNIGDEFYSIVGPLGEASPIEKYGTVVCLGGGYGVAALAPICHELRRAGNRVIGVIGAREKQLVLLEDFMKDACDEVRISTNDGSYGTKGFVTDVLQKIVDEGIEVNHTFAIGPVPMMAAVAKLTKELGISCTVSLNALMVDGTGMCGGCRVDVGGTTKFACCDGPDFDAHVVDFDRLMQRQKWYVEDEKTAIQSLHSSEPHSPSCLYKRKDIDEIEKFWNPNVPDAIHITGEPLKPKDRMAIPRQAMPHQKPEERIHNFDEVAMGFTCDLATTEANRCLECKKPKCVEGCPVGVNIPRFMAFVRAGKFLDAANVIKENNVLPAVCGRVCPQERQCESKCVLGGKCESVSIGRLERFVADYANKFADDFEWNPPEPKGKKIAVIGSGPSGLTVAGDLIAKGYEVHVFEALHRLGGVLIYGIPEFRLPNEIVDKEIEGLRKKGVQFFTNALIGKSKTIDDFLEREGYSAVFLGTGAGLPKMMNIPGEDLKGVYTANEYLTRINLMHADRFPEYGTPVTVGKRVAIVGCGNTSMDAARLSVRMGAEEVYIVYRRTIKESPARIEELEHAKEEGVLFKELTNPISISGTEDGWVKELNCIRMELGEPDESGRRSPVPIQGSEFSFPVDTVISALGFGINPLIPRTTTGLNLNKWGVIIADSATGKTSKKSVFAGGDSITGGSTVIMAMGQARVAAKAMEEYLTTGVW